jgi:hypothetical protein
MVFITPLAALLITLAASGPAPPDAWKTAVNASSLKQIAHLGPNFLKAAKVQQSRKTAS